MKWPWPKRQNLLYAHVCLIPYLGLKATLIIFKVLNHLFYLILNQGRKCFSETKTWWISSYDLLTYCSKADATYLMWWAQLHRFFCGLYKSAAYICPNTVFKSYEHLCKNPYLSSRRNFVWYAWTSFALYSLRGLTPGWPSKPLIRLEDFSGSR